MLKIFQDEKDIYIYDAATLLLKELSREELYAECPEEIYDDAQHPKLSKDADVKKYINANAQHDDYLEDIYDTPSTLSEVVEKCIDTEHSYVNINKVG